MNKMIKKNRTSTTNYIGIIYRRTCDGLFSRNYDAYVSQ